MSDSLKKRAGRMVPYPLIEAGRKLLHFGLRQCPVCLSRIRRLLDAGYGFPILEKLQVVGGMRRPADVCPVCHSSARERLVWYWLTHENAKFRHGRSARVAHFAPEKGLSRNLKDFAGDGYKAYDFDPSRYRHLRKIEQADLTSLTIEPSSVDLLICNHVMEHVPSPKRALDNIFQSLAPGGTAIMQVPIALALDESIELSADSTAQERIDRLGQDDHLRLYSQNDYEAVLTNAGFEVELFNAFDHDEHKATAWQLDPLERLFVCRRA